MYAWIQSKGISWIQQAADKKYESVAGCLEIILKRNVKFLPCSKWHLKN